MEIIIKLDDIQMEMILGFIDSRSKSIKKAQTHIFKRLRALEGKSR